MDYSIELHKHRYAAWAASRAASVKNCRFEVSDGRKIIEAISLNTIASDPERLPDSAQYDEKHREWRDFIIKEASDLNLFFTHGVAAKLINVYLKGMIICGGYHKHPKAVHIHPPIDRLLLDELYVNNVGGQRETWASARNQRWSRFDSDQYEAVISAIRCSMVSAPLWHVEEHWRGHQ